MAAYLDKIKITSNGRVSLGNAAMRNLSLKEGDTLEVFFDEHDGCLILKPESMKESPVISDNRGHSTRKGRGHGTV